VFAGSKERATFGNRTTRIAPRSGCTSAIAACGVFLARKCALLRWLRRNPRSDPSDSHLSRRVVRALDRRAISGTDVTRGRCTSSFSSSFPIRVLRDTLKVAVMNDTARSFSRPRLSRRPHLSRFIAIDPYDLRTLRPIVKSGKVASRLTISGDREMQIDVNQCDEWRRRRLAPS